MNDLKELFIPVCPPSKIRLGACFDGGYVMCPDFAEDRLISVGCENRATFEQSYLSLRPNAKVTIYDGTSQCDFAKQEERAEFINKNVYSFDDMDISSPCVIQMDIEGAEFDILNKYTGDFSNVSQFIIEWHWKLRNRKKPFSLISSAVEKINKHFHLIHMHGNTRTRRGAYPPVPNVLECTYVNKSLFEPTEIEPRPYPDLGVDRPNRRKSLNHKLDWWIV